MDSSDKSPYGLLFAKRITSLDALQSTLQNSAFASLDTECIGTRRGHRILCQVGLSYLPCLTPISANPASSKTSLEDFARQRGVSSTTINVAFGTVRPGVCIPGRMRQRFGNECTCTLDQLDGLVDRYLTGYSARCQFQGKTHLILVLFESQAEWQYMARHFPSAMRHFSAWIDVGGLCREIAGGGNVKLTNTLVALGYSHNDINLRRFACLENRAHNAGNDAVLKLAALEGLQQPDNRDKLRSLEAYRHIISSHRGPPNPLRMPFTAIIRSSGTIGIVLPPSLSSALSIARYFLDEYHPKRISVSAGQPAYAWVTFTSLQQLEYFVRRTHGMHVDGKALLITNFYDEDLIDNEASRSWSIRLLRNLRKRVVSAEPNLHLETLFSESNPAATSAVMEHEGRPTETEEPATFHHEHHLLP
ncbi:hypothetical protein F4803DRAFT_576595 [Xylaria telfairii]|nr:hypothetical protein F4803DRAFT_576595 [Xylaria telfairii]